MGKVIQIRVDESLKEVLENLRKEVANKIKSEYGLQEITVPRTLSSQILAAKSKGKQVLRFEIQRVSLTKGILRLFY